MTANNQSQKIMHAAVVLGALATFAAACGGGSDVTAAQACAEYAKNICAKFQACFPAFPASPGTSTCESSSQAQCLDSVRAPHTGYTPSVVSACAAFTGAATCADFYSTTPAACLPRGGTIPSGGACGDDWQCASGWCPRTTVGPCGSCVDRIAKGGPCPLGSGCADGLNCSFGATGANTCLSPAPLGGTCSVGQCSGNAYCKLPSSSSNQGICSLYPQAGQACDPVLQLCDYVKGVECNPVTMLCQNPAGTVQPGAACGWVAGQYLRCVGNCSPNPSGDGSTCTAVTQLVSEGQACGADGGTCALGQCTGGVCTDPGPTTCGGSGPTPEAGAPAGPPSTPPFDIWDGGLADASVGDAINVQVCATVDVSVDAAPGGPPALFPPACGNCCISAGYQAATINDGRCVCGIVPYGREGTACAEQRTSFGGCTACCSDAGFNGAGFHGPAGDAGGICMCNRAQDTVICASAAGDPNPVAACDLCCVRNGYPTYSYGNQMAGGTCACLSF